MYLLGVLKRMFLQRLEATKLPFQRGLEVTKSTIAACVQALSERTSLYGITAFGINFATPCHKK